MRRTMSGQGSARSRLFGSDGRGKRDEESDTQSLSSWLPYEPNATQLARVRDANIFDSLLYHAFCAANSSALGERRATTLVASRPRRPDGLALLDRVLGS